MTAATLVPLFLLGSLELVLRAVGYGYSTDFWRPSTIEGEEFVVPNPAFSHRFFPPDLARLPLPIRVATKKPENTFRIFRLIA